MAGGRHNILFNDLLVGKGIEPAQVLVLRHRPNEPELRKVLPWLAAEKPDVFNAYQQAQGPRVEKAMLKARYVAPVFIACGWRRMRPTSCVMAMDLGAIGLQRTNGFSDDFGTASADGDLRVLRQENLSQG